MDPGRTAPAAPNTSPQEAFRRALGALKGRVDFLDTAGVATISRTLENNWLIQLTNYTDIPVQGLSITVSDEGTVAVRLANGASAEPWLVLAKGGKENTGKKIRPEVALRKALGGLADWYTGPNVLLSASGRIKLSRPKDREEWFIDVFGYSGMRLEGFFITVQDSGKVVVKPAT